MRQRPTIPLSSNQYSTQVRSLGAVALNQWKQHFLQDHLPARRDCSQCIRAQGRSKPHRRVQHPSAFTLIIDLSGKMNEGDDQSERGCKYLMIGCYTFLVTREGVSFLPVPGREHQEEDKPLPGLEAEFEEIDQGGDGADHELPEEDEPMEEAEDRNVKDAKSMHDTWHRLVEGSSECDGQTPHLCGAHQVPKCQACVASFVKDLCKTQILWPSCLSSSQ